MSSNLDYFCVGDAICDEIIGLLVRCADKTLAKQDVFRVGCSGGHVAEILAEKLHDLWADFSRWQIFFCDECLVPESDENSTYGVFRRDLLNRYDEVPESVFFPVNWSLSPAEAAAEYEETIRKAFRMENTSDIPSFDLLILNIGIDGHTACLFPGHPLLDEKTRLIAPIMDSPEPPSCRVTMTYPLINNAKVCMFGAQGQSKAEVLKRILVDKDESLPASRVDPKDGKLIFVACDEADMLVKSEPTRKAKLAKENDINDRVQQLTL